MKKVTDQLMFMLALACVVAWSMAYLDLFDGTACGVAASTTFCTVFADGWRSREVKEAAKKAAVLLIAFCLCGTLIYATEQCRPGHHYPAMIGVVGGFLTLAALIALEEWA